MSLFRYSYFIVLLTLSTTAIAYAAGDRETIIQKQMDCTDEHLQQDSSISWNDVCDIPETFHQQHLQIVNQQMDQIQGIVAPPNATQQDFIFQNAPSYPQILPVKHEWNLELTSQVSYIRYHEPNVMKETGLMSGINTVLTYHPPEGDVLNSEITDVYRLETSFSYGKIKYNGGIRNSDGSVTPESFDGINDYLLDIRALAGKDFYFNKQSTRLTPYWGPGYRSLYDGLYANKPFGYNRRIQYLYLPAGAEVMTKLIDGWSIGADAEYDYFFRGFVTSYLGKIGLGNLTNTQYKGYGVRGSIKLVKNCNNFNFVLEPYVRFWHIQNSRIDTSTPFSYQGQEYIVNGYEPNNNSLEIGGRLGIEF